MARRSRNSDTIIIVLAIGVVVLPVMAVCAFVYFLLRCFLLPRRLSKSYLFPGKQGDEIDDVLLSIENVEDEIEDIREQGGGLELRADGFFDARNARGRRLNNALRPKYEHLDAAKNFREALEEYAEARIRKWSFNRAGRAASFVAIIVYIVAFFITSASGLPFLAVAGIAGATAGAAAGITWLAKDFSDDEISEKLALILDIESDDEADEVTDEISSGADDNEIPPARREDCFQVLGLTSAASADEIKAAYRMAIKQYHPDYVANLGVELKEVADRKTKELNAAYEEALANKGA